MRSLGMLLLVLSSTLVLTLLGPPARADDVRSAASVLHSWDAARATAYLAGDPAALRDLYAEGSTAGSADVRLLATYRRRGLQVAWLTTQVFAIDVLVSRSDELRLRIVDRVLGGVIGRSRCSVLPPAAPRARVLELRRRGGGWQMASVRFASATGTIEITRATDAPTSPDGMN